MRFGIFAVILILGSIPMTVLEHSMHAYYRSAMINNTQAQLQVQAVALAGEIGKYQDKTFTSTGSYEAVIRQYSTFSDSRILLVNYGYVIAYDSYAFESGKTIVSENVIKAFTTKKTISAYNKAAGSIEIMTPVLDDNKNAYAVVVMSTDVSEALNYTDDVLQKIYIIKVSAITMLIIIAFIISRILVRPIGNVTHQVNDIAMGHYDRRIRKGAYSELSDLSLIHI